GGGAGRGGARGRGRDRARGGWGRAVGDPRAGLGRAAGARGPGVAGARRRRAADGRPPEGRPRRDLRRRGRPRGPRRARRGADLADAQAVTRLFVELRAALGGAPDTLVNNAAVTHDAPLMMVAEEAWDRVIETNLKGAYLCSRAALRAMIAARGGHIVNVVSP